ncbi:MAG: MBL fold metallo-hydrolase [Patescibacteria group bacterium]
MKSKITILAGLLLIASATWFLVLIQKPEQILETIFLDVGQGDSILIKTPQNQSILIDGGPNNKVLEKLGKYLFSLSKKIDVVILTHPHADHVTGLIEVLKRYKVGLIVINGVYLKTDNYDQFISAAKNNGAKVLIAEVGEAIHFGKDLEFDIIAAPVSGVTNDNNANETSIVGKLIYNDFSIIFMGDAPAKIENKILAYGDGLKSDIIKIGHHGSKYSSFINFLSAVVPKAGIIEVAEKNIYSLPSPAALSRFAFLGINVFETGKKGDIKILSDGFTANIFTER